jgi:hypothetical protein
MTATLVPGWNRPPWSASETIYFYGGWLSSFAATPGLELPLRLPGPPRARNGSW